jgi:hypothetical protein
MSVKTASISKQYRYLQREIHISVSGMVIKDRDAARTWTFIRTVVLWLCMRAIGEIILWMDRGGEFSIVGVCMWGSGRRERNMVRECISGLMDENMKGSGRMGEEMGMGGRVG